LLVKKRDVCNSVLGAVSFAFGDGNATGLKNFFPVSVIQSQTTTHIASNPLGTVLVGKLRCVCSNPIEIGTDSSLKLYAHTMS
jgi:hypothetical protein